MITWIGKSVLKLAKSIGTITLIVQHTIVGSLHPLKSWKNILYQMNEIGVNTFPVTALTALFTGFVLALQTGVSFQKIFNEPVYVGTVVGLSLVKELGPVLTALVVSGRVGASIAAELGTMKVTEQIDALYTLGTNPIKYLAVPRFIACMITIPILTAISDFIGIMGGYIVCRYRLNIPPSVYWEDLFTNMQYDDVLHGLIKSVAFAAIIVIVSCYKGFVCEGGAEGVGRATTSAVVYSMVLVLVGDYFMSNLLISIGIG